MGLAGDMDNKPWAWLRDCESYSSNGQHATPRHILSGNAYTVGGIQIAQGYVLDSERASQFLTRWRRALVVAGELPAVSPRSAEEFSCLPQLEGCRRVCHPQRYNVDRGDAEACVEACVILRGEARRDIGLTFGVVNEIEAVVRFPAPGGSETLAWEALVIPMGDEPFSKGGDSGSCVFDVHGRIVRMVTGGVEYGELSRCGQVYSPSEGTFRQGCVLNPKTYHRGADVTFVSPIQLAFGVH